MFRFPNINQCVKNALRLRKVELIKCINLINTFLYLSFANGMKYI